MISSFQPLPSGALRQAEVVTEVRRRILHGELAPGSRLPPVVEWIKAFSTSPHTVQRAIGHLRKAGFVVSRKGVGNYVSPHPPHLCHVAMVFPEDPVTSSIWMNNFFTAWRDAAKACNAKRARRADGLRLSIFQECGGLDVVRNNRELLHLAEESRLAGIIFICSPLRLDAVMSKFAGLPIVTVLARRPYAMGIELTDMLPQALDFLARRGRKRVALLSGALDPDAICDAFVVQAAERGMVTRDTWMQHGNAEAPEWSSRLIRLLFGTAPADRPDALVIDNDNLVPSATRGLREAGVRMSKALDVVAGTNFPSVLSSVVPIHRIGYDIQAALDIALDLIARRRRGEVTPDSTLLPLIERDDNADKREGW